MSACIRVAPRCSGWEREYFYTINGKHQRKTMCDGCVRAARSVGIEVMPVNGENAKGIAWVRRGEGLNHAVHMRTDGTLERHTLCGSASDGMTDRGSRRHGSVCGACKDRYARKPLAAPVGSGR